MKIAEIIIFIILFTLIISLSIYFYKKVYFAEKEIIRISYSSFQFILTMFVIGISMILLIQKQIDGNKLENKCPEYEKVDNLYRIK